MNNESGAYRWWENYLVRYFMPSIAGAIIINWLVTVSGSRLRNILLLDVGGDGLQASTLLLLFLYGNLFCYVSSYPILVFHVTRVVDFKEGVWRKGLLDGYIATLVLALATFILTVACFGSSAKIGYVAPFILACAYVGMQLYRIHESLCWISFNGISGNTTKVFAYTYAISRRRGVAEDLCITKQASNNQVDDDTGDNFDEESERHRRSIFRRELVDSYRHMREHGNSAYIFLLELTLAGLCFHILVSYKNLGATYQLSAIGVLFAIWAIPAMFIHFVGQHIERRFSLYDKYAGQTKNVFPDNS